MLNAGVVGVGFIGRVHIEALRRLGNVRVAAIADPVEPRRKADELHIERAFDDYRKMLDEMGLDVVHICTPNDTHVSIALYALEKGVHVVCEKPLANSVGEAEMLAGRFREAGLIHAVNYHNRCYPMVEQMHGMIQHGEIGEVLSVTGSYLQDWMSAQTDCNWRVGGVLRAVSDIGVHLLDLAEYVTGLKITRLAADFSTVYKERLVLGSGGETFSGGVRGEAAKRVPVTSEDMAAVLFRLENGALGNAFVSQMFAGETNSMELKIAGSRKTLSWTLDRPDTLLVGERDQPGRVYHKNAAYTGDAVRGLISYPPGHAEGFCDAFKHHFAAVYGAVEKRENRSYAAFDDGARSEKLCARMLESNQRQCWVKI